jgi:uncharacterized protein (DUF1499 family)
MAKRILAVVALIFAGAAAGLALHFAVSGGDTVFAGKRPDYLGVKDGQLARCKRTPNCVGSQTDASDTEHYIAPIAFKGAASEAMAAVRGAVEGMQRATVIRSEPGYLYAEFRSKLMGFVDDVEFLSDASSGLIHVRSASRLGRRDFGVNRERVEALRAAIAASGKARPGVG